MDPKTNTCEQDQPKPELESRLEVDDRVDEASATNENKDQPDQSLLSGSSPRPPQSPSIKSKPVLVVVNPNSGRGKSLPIYSKCVLPILDSNNIEHQLFITQAGSRIFDFLNDKTIFELERLKAIVVVSGDGLLHETLNALMSRRDWKEASKIPLCIIPTGSGNGLAYTLIRTKYPNLDNPDDAVKLSCNQILHNETCQSDLVKITYGPDYEIWSFLSFGWGLLADIDIDSEWLRQLGELRFTLYGLLRSITSKSHRCRLSFKLSTLNRDSPTTSVSDNAKTSFTNLDDSYTTFTTDQSGKFPTVDPDFDGWIHIEDKFACIYANYQPYVSRVTKISPKSTLNDETIYLTYIRGNLSPCRVIEFLLAIQDGSHENLSYVTVVPVTKFKFLPMKKSRIVVDGEVIPWQLNDGPLSANIVPKVMNLLWKG